LEKKKDRLKVGILVWAMKQVLVSQII